MDFFSLPGEMRNAIYDQILFPDCHTLLITHCSRNRDVAELTTNLPIFRVSKKIRAEVLARLLSNKRVEIVNAKTALLFLKYVGKFGRDNLVDMGVIMPLSSDLGIRQELISALSSLEKIKRLELRFPLVEQTASDRENWETFRKLKTAMEGRGVEVTLMVPTRN